MTLAACRRALALLLLLVSALPVYALLQRGGGGHAASVTVMLARGYTAFTWSGLLLLLIPALLLARALPQARATRLAGYAQHALLRPSERRYALALAALSFSFAWLINQRVLQGEPNLIDALAQLVQARYFAAGRLAGPAGPFGAFWHMQQTLAMPAGWVSQYPPGHALLLALGMLLRVPQLVGPVLLALTVFVTARLAARLLPEDRVAARLGALLLALSPFAAAHAAAYMNHTSAALFSVLAVYAALLVRERRSIAASAALGAALAALFSTRPLTALVVGAVSLAWVAEGYARRGEWPARRALAAFALAALPLLAAMGMWNQHFFGSPWRFGYTAALGPAGGLGFGIDPWGNHYGLREAIGYTSAELAALNLFLLETPLPVVTLVALYLVLSPRLDAPVRLLAGWITLPLLANLLYWHHGLFMGPRMLNEYAPAWCLLGALVALRLLRAVPQAWTRAPGWSPRVLLGSVLALGWLSALVLAPARLASYRSHALPVPQLAATLPQPALVFVHGSWGARLAMQLAAGGMRLDSLETVMRQNSTCTVQRWLDGERAGIRLVFEREASKRLAPPQRELVPGSAVRLQDGEVWPSRCAREVAADATGVVEVSAYLWRAGLPGIDDGLALLVRDLGPEQNRRIILALRRPAYMLELDRVAGRLSLHPYRAVVRRVWPDSTGSPRAASAATSRQPSSRTAGAS